MRDTLGGHGYYSDPPDQFADLSLESDALGTEMDVEINDARLPQSTHVEDEIPPIERRSYQTVREIMANIDKNRK